MRHRAASIDMGHVPTPWTVAPRTPGASLLFRWDPWVRSYLVAQELMRTMDFLDIGAQYKPHRGLTLNTFVMKAGGLDPTPHPLVTLVAPPDATYVRQIEQVLSWSELREDRMPEILVQAESTMGFWGSLIPVQTERLKSTRELLDAAVRLAMFVEMRFKHHLACWRPIDYSPYVQPAITTPGHASTPSGHCTEAYVIYEVLKALLNSQTEDGQPCPARSALNRQFRCLVERVAMNRVVAGLHFPVDNLAGRVLGTVLGRYVVHRCMPTGKPACPSASFIGPDCPPDEVYDPASQRLLPGEDQHPDLPMPAYYRRGADLPVLDEVPNDILAPLWLKASQEVLELGLVYA
jgi:hypothetical protein